MNPSDVSICGLLEYQSTCFRYLDFLLSIVWKTSSYSRRSSLRRGAVAWPRGPVPPRRAPTLYLLAFPTHVAHRGTGAKPLCTGMPSKQLQPQPKFAVYNGGHKRAPATEGQPRSRHLVTTGQDSARGSKHLSSCLETVQHNVRNL